jgi:cytochrome c oxidase subunit 4
MITHHVEPKKTYFAIFAALMALTVLTVWASRIDLGAASVFVALAIAVVKAMLVVLFFMHVWHSSPLTKFTVGAGFLWLAILLALTLADYYSRNWLPTPEGW